MSTGPWELHNGAVEVAPVVLEGRIVRLEPANEAHAPDLARHMTPETFQHFATLRPREKSTEAMSEFIRRSHELPNMIVFAQVLRETGEAIGMTSYLDIRPEHRGLEIGFTWISPEHRGTQVNPESKLLLLSHAFETLGCLRVQLKTDLRNVQSQAAIAKLGAVREGVLRKHLILPDGHVRDTVMFSIIAEEWPAVRAGLQARLG